jgi:hypothetical protein
MELVNIELAKAEVKKWLDHKKISEKKREKNQDNIEALVEAIVDGHLALNETKFTFTHTLKFPTGENGQLTKLEYKSRLEVKEIQMQMQGIKSTDLHGIIISYACALTGKPRGVIAALDSEDYAIVQGIASFFF